MSSIRIVKVLEITAAYGHLLLVPAEYFGGLLPPEWPLGASLASGVWGALFALLKVDGIIVKESRNLFHYLTASIDSSG